MEFVVAQRVCKEELSWEGSCKYIVEAGSAGLVVSGASDAFPMYFDPCFLRM